MPLADWVEVKGKHVTTIYVTHEHGDHYLGAPILLARFPDARLVSSATVVEQIRPQFATPIVEKYWRPMFNGRVADGQVLPDVLADNVIDLEGHQITAHDVGQSDCEHSTFLHLEDASAVVVGDIAYNGVHMHLGYTDHAKRLAWIETIRSVATLGAQTVIAATAGPSRQRTHRNAWTRAFGISRTSTASTRTESRSPTSSRRCSHCTVTG